MNSTILHIKNMVCNRCIKVVNDEFHKLNLTIEDIQLGKVRLEGQLSDERLEEVRTTLEDNGFELIDDKKNKIIDEIKTHIIEKVHHSEELFESVNLSSFLATEMGYDYSYLSHLFSSVEGITIEKYTINQRIERVKELLVYNEMSLKEIAYQMGYSSVQHLSSQFKKVTGFTPSQYKKIKENSRKPLDEV